MNKIMFIKTTKKSFTNLSDMMWESDSGRGRGLRKYSFFLKYSSNMS